MHNGLLDRVAGWAVRCWPRRVLCTVVVVGLLGCASMRAQHWAEPGFVWPRQASYAWLATRQASGRTAVPKRGLALALSPAEQAARGRRLIGRRMRLLLNRRMQALGYRRQPRRAADLWVGWSCGVARTLDAAAVEHYGEHASLRGPTPSPPYSGVQVTAEHTAQVVVWLVDRVHQRVRWRGRVRFAVDAGEDPCRDRRRLGPAVDAVLKRLPRAPGAPRAPDDS